MLLCNSSDGCALFYLVTVLVTLCPSVWAQLTGNAYIDAAFHLDRGISYRDGFEDLVALPLASSRYSKQQQHWSAEDKAEELYSTYEQMISSQYGFAENIYNVSEQCLIDIFAFLGHLRHATNDTQASWALQMVDAQAKLPSGVVEGNLKWLGSYEECLNITALDVEKNGTWSGGVRELFKGKYCVAVIHKGNQSVPAIPGMAQANQMSLALTLGLCLPDSCSDLDVKHLLYLDLFPVELYLNTTDISADVACPQPLSVGDDWRAILAIIILSLLGSFILVGTLYDVCLLQIPRCLMETAIRERALASGDFGPPSMMDGDHVQSPATEKTPLLGQRKEDDTHVEVAKPAYNRVCQFLLAFSLYTNGSKLLSTKQGSASLRCVNGVRFLSMSWVILGHSYAFGLSGVDNLASFLEVLQRWSFLAIANATFSVDSFFFLSGLLVTYLCMKEMDRRGGNLKINWAMFYFHRFWRLTPPYMLVLMFDACLFRYLGSGPQWPPQGVEIDFCANSWWKNLLYINNLFSFKEMCMAWSWYISNDMQFFIISPLVLIPLYRSGKFGGAVILTMMLTCLIVTGVTSSYYEIPVGFADIAKINLGFDKIYQKPWCRIGTYLVGMVVGYLLYKTNCRVRLNLGVVILGWMVAAIACLAVLYGVYNDYHGDPMSVPTAAFYNAVSRPVWAIGLGWVVFACCTGYGGFVNTILSWEPFVPLGRLTYCAYLIHPLVILFFYLHQRSLIHSTDLNEVYYFLGNLVTSYGLAFVTSLVFEAPFMGLEKVIFKREKSV